MPSRRTYLTGVLAGLAGCSGSPKTDDDQGGEQDRPPENSPTDTEPTPSDVVLQENAHAAVAWVAKLPRSMLHQPVVDAASDTVYVGVADGYLSSSSSADTPPGALFALNRADGSERWRNFTDTPVLEQPVVHDGRAHVVAGNTSGDDGVSTQVVAFGEGGDQQWATAPKEAVLDIVAANDGSLFVGSSDDPLEPSGETLFAVSGDGTVAWEQEAGDATSAQVRDGQLLYDAGGQALAAYDPQTGDRLWQASGEPLGNPTADIVTADGRCFLKHEEQTENGYPLIAHSTGDGTERWRYVAESTSGDQFRPTGVGVAGAEATGVDSGLIVGTEHGGTVFGLSPEDGSEQWSFTAEYELLRGPVVDEQVYVADSVGILYALDASDGTEQWRARVGEYPQLLPFGDGILASASGDRAVLAAFDADGSQRWRYESLSEFSRPVINGEMAFVVRGDGAVMAFGKGA